jgi:hypothetical protein
MIEFINGSGRLHFFITGDFTLSKNTISVLYNHWLKTNENLVDTYAEAIDTYYDATDNNMGNNCLTVINEDDYKIKVINLEKIMSLGLLTKDYYVAIMGRYNADLAYYYKNSTKDKIRLTASRYTSRKDIRKKVFDKYGKKCLCCNSTMDIQIDHVIPVFDGGKNELENLQPLCKKCNVTKRTKFIDYRKQTAGEL